MKISTRIILSFFLITSLSFLYITNWLTKEVKPHYYKSMEEVLADTSTILSSVIAADTGRNDLASDEFRAAFNSANKRKLNAKIYDVVKTKVDMRVYVTDDKGIVLFDSDNGKDEGKDYSKWNDVHKSLRNEYGTRSSKSDPNDPNSTVIYVASPIMTDGRIAGVLTVSKPAHSMSTFIEKGKDRIIKGFLILGIGLIVTGIAATLWITRPIYRLTAYAKAVRDGGRPRLPELGKNEIGSLGQAFEETKDALEGKKYIEKYVQTLTHELKSPVSAILGAAELLKEDMGDEERRHFLSNIELEGKRIQSIVERLLHLAIIEGRKGLVDVEYINLTKLTSEVVESFRPAAAVKDITIDLQGEDASISGERFLLRQAISNLIQNSIEFTPTGGRISCGIKRQEDFMHIIIDDTGPGIPDYAVDRIFERFYSLQRPDTGKKSSGLGLSFAKEVAELHGGNISMENRPDKGARSVITLPIAIE